MVDGVTHMLADFCARLRYDDLPPEVVDETKRVILDTIGCGLGGYAVEKGRMGVEFAQRTGGAQEATIVGRRGKVPATMAAFANGELMHALDWCPVQPPAHVSAYVLPPVLALAEARQKSGRDLIVAMALAMEVSGRISNAIGGLRATPGGFPRRVWGLSTNQLGGTAGAGLLLGFDTERMLHALGASGYYAPLASHVKYNHTTEVGYAKYGPSGWMAQGAVTTALLAEMGYRGDITFLEGEHGFYVQNGAETWKPEKLLSGLGQDWVFMNIGYKRWPSNGMNQSAIDVFVDLIEDFALRPDEITDVTYRIEAFGGIPKYTNQEPMDHVEAASSGPYALAVAAHRIKRGPGWQDDAVLWDPKIRAFMKKVHHDVTPRAEILRRQDLEIEGRPYLRHRPADVIIKARGQVFERSTDFGRWFSIDPDWRAGDEDLAGKFRENAEIVLDGERTERTIGLIADLDRLDDLSDVIETLAG